MLLREHAGWWAEGDLGSDVSLGAERGPALGGGGGVWWVGF